MLNSRLLKASAAALLLFAAGCGDDDGDDNTGSAQLRVVHGSPDAPAVDIYAAGVSTPLVAGLGYGQASPYLDLDPGSYTVQIRAAGAAADSDPVFSVDLSLSDDDRVTALAAGRLSSTAADDQFRVIPLAEGFSAPAAGNAIVRIVHNSADAPTVGIDVGNDGSVEVDALDRFADTGAAGVELPANEALQIGIVAGGQPVTAFTTPELPDGGEIFVIASGLLGDLPRQDTGFSLLAVAPTGAIGFIKQNPVVFALHASPDAPAVDIYAGDSALGENLAFTEISAPIQVPPGAYDLDFYAAGSFPGTPAASATTPELAAGERYLAVASGFLGATGEENPFQLIPLAEGFEIEETGARIRALHASPDAPAVDIGTVTGNLMDAPPLVQNVAFPNADAAAGLAVPAATLDLGVAAAGSGTPVAEFSVTTADGLRAFAVAAGALTPTQDRQSFRLLLVITNEFPWTVAEVLPSM